MAKTTLGFVPIAYIAGTVLSLVELGLTAYIASVYDGTYWSGYYDDYYSSSSPDRVNFMLWNSIWSLLVFAYVATPLYASSFYHKPTALALEAITMIFWFAGSVALAVFIGVPRCGGNGFCQTLQAAVAFGFFIWAIFLFLMVLDAVEMMRSRRPAGGNYRNNPKAYTGA